jgi:Zn-dependent peptidase ImmA (M78 family)
MRTTINQTRHTAPKQLSFSRGATASRTCVGYAQTLLAAEQKEGQEDHEEQANDLLAVTSMLTELRDVTPFRSLGLSEAMRVAELQANKLRAHLNLDETAMPNEMIANQPRIRIVFEEAIDGKASGASHWDNTSWIITLNPLEPLARQRFSLFHEYKHIIDDRFKTFLYQDERTITARFKAEKVADYFAACALMPKLLVKRHFCGGVTDLHELADLFDVSERAMEVRLEALGLRAAEPSRSFLQLKAVQTPLGFTCTRGRNSRQAHEYRTIETITTEDIRSVRSAA